jgi:peptidoglycan biosynthesis protein MviN/MurJ (putative lipid II flippase)
MNYGKYVLTFSLFCCAVLIMMLLASALFDARLGNSVSLAMAIGAGYGTAMRFVLDHHRAPSTPERRKLVLLCLLSCLAITAMAMAVLLPMQVSQPSYEPIVDLLSSIAIPALLALVMIVIAIHYLLLNWIFSWSSRKFAEQIQRS